MSLEINVRCDECDTAYDGRMSGDGTTISEIRKRGRKEGWRYFRDENRGRYVDICPDCIRRFHYKKEPRDE